MYEHLIINGIIPGYRIWTRHGEMPSVSSSRTNTCIERVNDDMHEMLCDALGMGSMGIDDGDDDVPVEEPISENAHKFFKLTKDAEKPLHRTWFIVETIVSG